MPSTRCLYIEDDARDREHTVAYPFEAEFHKAFPHAKLDVTPVDFDEGERLLADRDAASTFQIILVDLLEKKPDGRQVLRGIDLIFLAVENSQAAIIAISQDAENLPEAEAAGAHAFIAKVALMRVEGRNHLRAQITSAVREANVIIEPATEVEVSWDRDDLRVSALVEEVGLSNLGALLVEVFSPAPDRVKVRYVRSGLSGSLVLYCAAAQGPELLLKVNRDEARARREESAWCTAAFGQLSLPRLESGVVSAGGWYALGLSWRRGRTLLDWLAGDPPAAQAADVEAIEKCLDTLFGEGGLSEVAATSAAQRPDDRPVQLLHDALLTPRRAASVQLAVERLTPLLEHYSPDHATRLGVVSAFVRSGVVANAPEKLTPHGSWVAKGHGDLHAKNVLVDRGGNPTVLDVADSDWFPWCTDWARLIVDLYVSGIATDWRSHEWGALEDWQVGAASIVSGEGVPETPCLPEPCRIGINWLRQNALHLAATSNDNSVYDWELQLALAVEFLRATYRVAELPATVRLAALIACIEGLEHVAESLPPGPKPI